MNDFDVQRIDERRSFSGEKDGGIRYYTLWIIHTEGTVDRYLDHEGYEGLGSNAHRIAVIRDPYEGGYACIVVTDRHCKSKGTVFNGPTFIQDYVKPDELARLLIRLTI